MAGHGGNPFGWWGLAGGARPRGGLVGDVEVGADFGDSFGGDVVVAAVGGVVVFEVHPEVVWSADDVVGGHDVADGDECFDFAWFDGDGLHGDLFLFSAVLVTTAYHSRLQYARALG